MAFKMKGSAFKLGNVATKSALKQTSPMKQEVVATTEPVEETEEVVEEKVNPYGDHMKSVEANTWKQINTGDISENWKNLQEQLARSEKHGYDTKGLKKTMREVQRAMERRKLPLL